MSNEPESMGDRWVICVSDPEVERLREHIRIMDEREIEFVQTIERLREALRDKADREPHSAEGWVHWRETAREALAKGEGKGA